MRRCLNPEAQWRMAAGCSLNSAPQLNVAAHRIALTWPMSGVEVRHIAGHDSLERRSPNALAYAGAAQPNGFASAAPARPVGT
jgi:hypothetical protein